MSLESLDNHHGLSVSGRLNQAETLSSSLCRLSINHMCEPLSAMTVGDGEPFEFPNAMKRKKVSAHIEHQFYPIKQMKSFTFPNAGPEYIPVVDIHHYPLTI
jgi:hypothetical protein